MANNTTTAKRLAKNTAFMYARMGLLMLISLYTSRVILQKLGIDDYGTYNLVGSIVSMFAALRGFFASSTQRFINFEMGRGNNDRLTLIFNMSIVINLLLSIVFIIAVEGVGYWFLNYKMVIDPTRLFAAKVVFQLSVISAIVSMFTTPFDALIIAHERMDIYAYFAIIEGVLRLGVVFLLGSFGFDKLIFYGFLQLSVTLIIILLNVLFCRRSFEECRYKRSWDKKVFKEMTSFACWNFVGNTAYSLVQSGLNMLLNMFCGLAANTARGIAYQANSAVSRVQKSISIVVNPFSTKAYASGRKNKMFAMMFFTTKAYYTILSCLVIPLVFMAPQILRLWLGQVPDYSVGFLQLVLLYSLIRTPHEPITSVLMSVGNIKLFQIAEILIQTSTVIISYFLLKKGCSPYWLFGAMNIVELFNYIAILIIAKKVALLPLGQYLRKAIFPCFCCFVVSLLGFLLTRHYLDNTVVLCILTATTLVVVFLFMFFIGLSQFEREQLLSIVKKG